MSEAIEFSVDLSGFTKAMNALPEETLKATRIAVKEGLTLLVKEARTEYDSKSRHHEKEGHKVERCIQQRLLDDFTGAVFLNLKDCPYAEFIHEGTHDHMVPKEGHEWGLGTTKGGNPAALHWVSGGKSFFSKGHKVSGIEKDQFLYRAAEKNENKIIDIFEKQIDKAIKRAGF